MENMDMEVSKEDLPDPKVKQDTNTLLTTGLILEISVAIIIRSESDVKLPDRFSWKEDQNRIRESI
jgi:hypothetical protein